MLSLTQSVLHELNLDQPMFETCNLHPIVGSRIFPWRVCFWCRYFAILHYGIMTLRKLFRTFYIALPTGKTPLRIWVFGFFWRQFDISFWILSTFRNLLSLHYYFILAVWLLGINNFDSKLINVLAFQRISLFLCYLYLYR